jgi:hypothetical protein
VNKKITAISFFLVVILFVSAIAGTIVYYKGKISEITLLKDEIANLNSQISNLKSQVRNLTSPNLVTALGIKDIQYGLLYYLYIKGSMTNTGVGIAYNTGLRVVAYDAQGTLEINMTVPLDGGIFGADNQTKSFVSEYYGNYPSQLVDLYSNQTDVAAISIFHEGVVSNWTVIPVWTNNP